jgi:hypothetical protein
LGGPPAPGPPPPPPPLPIHADGLRQRVRKRDTLLAFVTGTPRPPRTMPIPRPLPSDIPGLPPLPPPPKPASERAAQHVALFNVMSPINPGVPYEHCLRALRDPAVRDRLPVTIAAHTPPPLDTKRLLIDNDGITYPKLPYTAEPSTPLVVYDLDGTLSTGNLQLFWQLAHPAHQAVARQGAADITWAWAARGYGTVYLTGRPWWLAPMTRTWFRRAGFAPGAVHFTHRHLDMVPITSFTGVFKRLYLKSLRKKGYHVAYAYGNVATDIWAYSRAGVPTQRMVTTGSAAGAAKTIPAVRHFGDHLPYIAAQPECPR